MTQNHITLKIDGMTCGHCVASVTEELREVDGVTDVDVILAAGGTSTATVTTSAPVRELTPRSGGHGGRLHARLRERLDSSPPTEGGGPAQRQDPASAKRQEMES